ncbi:MAG: FAD-dependent oxidoreductase [Proteobacteria bacterium]|nr:FAD-dependent oxidoreductase [Pseudomonadota bacterium]MBU1741054.1 FAD-dependent oxidoreductase [Pseudomonadota bacterium]
MKTVRHKADAVVVGSGPGGATVARALARAGRRVLLLEKGRHHARVGNHLSALSYTDRMGLRFTEEGLNIVRALTTGGSTILYCGAATEPPPWLQAKYGIDLEPHVRETINELGLHPLPDEVVGQGAMRILEAANDLGHRFEKLRKFIDPDRCRIRCGGTCMLGCPHGAKWTARDYVADMVAAGGKIINGADVRRVIIQDGAATGVLALTPRGRLEVEAEVVVVAAGGLGTPTILRRSGLDEAGVGMFLDPLVMVTGVSRHAGTSSGPPMSVGTYEFMEDEGILLSNLIDPWGLWLIMVARKNPARLGQFLSYRRQLGLMVKIGDELAGYVTPDGRVSKPLTRQDHDRLDRGAAVARRILIRAGCHPRSIIVGPVRGAHPGATARLGRVVDDNLQTRVANLFVSDASVLPQALDRPMVLTIIGLAKRLADHLLSTSFQSQV